MATKTKNKLSKALKNTFLNELKDKKETERLERVKANANLKEVTIYTHKDQKNCKTHTDFLTQEGIKFTEVEISEGKGVDEFNKIMATTNLNFVPTISIDDRFLVHRRDFQTTQQLVQAIQHFAKPNFEEPTFEHQIVEQMKTNQYNMFQRINQLQQQLTPLVKFIQNLEKQLSEEEGE